MGYFVYVIIRNTTVSSHVTLDLLPVKIRSPMVREPLARRYTPVYNLRALDRDVRSLCHLTNSYNALCIGHVEWFTAMCSVSLRKSKSLFTIFFIGWTADINVYYITIEFNK